MAIDQRQSRAIYGRQVVTKESHPKQDEQNQESTTRKRLSQVCGTKLNNELNTQTDWDQVWRDMRNSGISISDSTSTKDKFMNSK